MMLLLFLLTSLIFAASTGGFGGAPGIFSNNAYGQMYVTFLLFYCSDRTVIYYFIDVKLNLLMHSFSD